MRCVSEGAQEPGGGECKTGGVEGPRLRQGGREWCVGGGKFQLPVPWGGSSDTQGPPGRLGCIVDLAWQSERGRDLMCLFW